MADQASELRELVRQRSEAISHASRPGARIVTLLGGKGGVGTTSIAVNLASYWARNKNRVLLIDTDFQQGNVATFCGVTPRATTRDILSDSAIEKAILQTADSLDLLCARSEDGNHLDETAWNSSTDPRKLFRRLAKLSQYEIIVVDAGNRIDRMTREAHRASELTVAISTADLPALMDTYKAIKQLHREPSQAKFGTLVNMEPDRPTGQEVHRRIEIAAHQFLGLKTNELGSLSMSAEMVAAANTGIPIVRAKADCLISGQIAKLAETIEKQLTQSQADTKTGRLKSTAA
jgi:flagellar biosynthesis protein FlhG